LEHEPHYRIVAQDSRHFRSKLVSEELGYYNPRTSPSTLKYDKEAVQKWLSQGAQLTDTMHDIFVKEGLVKQKNARTARIKAIIADSKKRIAEGEEDKPSQPKVEKATETPNEKEPTTTETPESDTNVVDAVPATEETPDSKTEKPVEEPAKEEEKPSQKPETEAKNEPSAAS